MAEGISSHGTILEYQPTPGGAFVEVAEMGDIVPPGLMRNKHDTTPHNRDIDSNVLGVLRREDPTFPVFFHKDNESHAESTGLYKLMIDNVRTGFRITQPDGWYWVFSGGVKDIKHTDPVDGVQTANISLAPTGPMIINGTTVGA